MDDVAGHSAFEQYERRRAVREARLRRRFGRLAPVAGLIDGPSSSERAWRRGAEGEKRTAERLARHLDGSGVVVLHDRRIPGSRANIDHLAIGPAGITVIDSKNYKGKVRVRGGRLWVNGRNRTKLVRGVKRQCEVARAVIAPTPFADVPIEAALAWVDVDGLPFFRTLRLEGVLIDGTRKIAKRAAREGPLTPEQIAELGSLLLRELPAATVRPDHTLPR